VTERYCDAKQQCHGDEVMNMHQWVEKLEHKLGIGTESFSEKKRRILKHISDRTVVARDVSHELKEKETFGQWLADRVAEFGGSWTFISLFLGILVLWTTTNALILIEGAFDPYPFIFLNLLLSMLAALQAPIIMMSQNRQSSKDRAAAQHDYEVNLKAELEIMTLHEKLDHVRTEQLASLIQKQEEQIRLLTQLLQSKSS
jgi:uncharacterized membrane protein